jgi:predicted SnoaL-like aldol condensation-catalyzing enzyme
MRIARPGASDSSTSAMYSARLRPAPSIRSAWNAVDIYRIRDGRISEEWAADDIAAIMNQLGAFSPPWLG